MGEKRMEKDKPKNSSMAKDMEEIKHHGRVMERMNTNEKVKDKGKEPDPEQHNPDE
ncbi:hypothetical protein [Thalassobacillus pellis]|uniref:hypothetical protein n=1 Tax=Thalassobacillus pellis TaxID=748008 RepID=UPI001961437D|nr:hypothetical protein [Thalassobacillus pellis]MBM7551221.1 hypothetical protein [Thalassobacillus pellis]